MEKTLDTKLRKLQQDPDCGEFILADAKDADMAFGLAAPGRCPQSQRWRTIAEYRELIRELVEQGQIDIALMSASTCEVLAADEKIFDESAVTPAVRANDSTDIWLASGTGGYANQFSLPFRSASIESMKCVGVQLGLYSLTLNNDAIADRESLEAYATFRQEAAAHGFHHFLEIFPPNAPGKNGPPNVARFIADSVARTLAGLTRAERPLFLKIPYLGPALTEQLAAYDRSVLLGIMGGPSGTTFDAFALLADAQKYGVCAALFGRHINQAEDQLTFVAHLRRIVVGDFDATEAVRSYHAELSRLKLNPQRPLEDDLQRTVTGIATYATES